MDKSEQHHPNVAESLIGMQVEDLNMQEHLEFYDAIKAGREGLFQRCKDAPWFSKVEPLFENEKMHQVTFDALRKFYGKEKGQPEAAPAEPEKPKEKQRYDWKKEFKNRGWLNVLIDFMNGETFGRRE